MVFDEGVRRVSSAATSIFAEVDAAAGDERWGYGAGTGANVIRGAALTGSWIRE